MRRVLVIAYNYPPIGGAGVQRNLRLVQHLRPFGYEPVVLTGPGRAQDRWAPVDADLAGSAPRDVEVHRLETPEPETGGARGRLERLLRIEHPWSRWWSTGVATSGGELARTCDLVWVLMQPYASAEPASRIARGVHVPWVADLADPWALDEMLVYPSALHRRLELRRMGSVLRLADGIVMNTPEAARRVGATFPQLRSIPITIGPCGWDTSDFEAPPGVRSDASFRIVHTGYLHTELGIRQQRTARVRWALGGGRDNARIITRSHVFLLRALERLFDERPELRGRVEVHLAGVLSEADRAVIGDNPAVRAHGYLDHADSVALLRSADLLFLPMHDLPPGVRAGLVPGKTYEYLASGRPILGAVPDGDARDLLASSGNAFLCRPDDVEGMKAALSERIDARLAGLPVVTRVPEIIERFEYRHLARELASFFDSLFDPGRREPEPKGHEPVSDDRAPL